MYEFAFVVKYFSRLLVLNDLTVFFSRPFCLRRFDGIFSRRFVLDDLKVFF